MILITGATGSNGTELIKLLASRGIAARALVRNPDKAGEITLPGIEIFQGDLDDPNSLRAALDGIERAFLLTPSSERAEAQQIGFVEAAKAAGVEHIVNLSQFGASADSPNRFLRYHAAVEAAIKNSGLTYTFLRPNLFMQALLNFRSTIVQQNAFYAAAGNAKVSAIDVRDIAEVAAASLTKAGHENKAYELTGPEALTHTEMAAHLSAAVGRTITFVDVPPQAMHDALINVGFPLWQADGLIEEFAEYRAGHAEAVATGVRDVLGKPPRNFVDFALDYANVLK